MISLAISENGDELTQRIDNRRADVERYINRVWQQLEMMGK